MASGKGHRWWALVLVLSLALIAFGLIWEPEPVDRDLGHRTLPLTTAPQGGDFTLSGNGQPFNLADYRGRVVLLYFGYTFCPDVCPTSMAMIRQAVAQLDAEQLERVQGIFVSVDPGRDTPERVADYARFFHPSILGVTGSEEELAEAGRLYGAGWQRTQTGSAMGYAVDHSSNTYVIGTDGRLVETLPHGTGPQRILETVLRLLDEE
jgi:protein SCO1